MVFIINDKIYDIEKMELLSLRDIPSGWEYNIGTSEFERPIKRFFLYVSKKGNYLLRCDADAIALSEDEAKRFLRKYDCATYVKLFKELEEA